MTITVELLHDDAHAPRRATEGSAGYDLCAYVRSRSIKCSDGQRTWTENAARDGDAFDLAPGVTALVPLGVEAQIRPRSGTTFKKGLAIPNAPGTIDSDFPDEWMVLVKNPTPTPIRIDHGERIAQMVLARFEILAIETGRVEITTDRVGGFGSTGS